MKEPNKMKTETMGPAQITARKKVFIVDDHPLIRRGLAQLIAQESDLSVCGEAESTQQTFEKLKLQVPDMTMVDVSLGSENGLDLVKELKTCYPHLPVLVVSVHDEEFYAERALHAGASGYIMKTQTAAMLLKAIRCVLEGKVYLSDTILAKILKKISAGKDCRQSFFTDRLSKRELQVFRLIGTGLGSRLIAQKLSRSVKTIESYREHIKLKLDLKNSSELVQSAVQWLQRNSTIIEHN